MSLLSAAVVDPAGRPTASLPREEPVVVEVRFRVREPVPALDLGLYIEDFRNARVIDEAWSESAAGERGLPGEYVARIAIPSILPIGDYIIGLWMGSAYEVLVDERDALRFRLEGVTSRWADRVVQLGLAWDVQRADVPTRAPLR